MSRSEAGRRGAEARWRQDYDDEQSGSYSRNQYENGEDYRVGLADIYENEDDQRIDRYQASQYDDDVSYSSGSNDSESDANGEEHLTQNAKRGRKSKRNK